MKILEIMGAILIIGSVISIVLGWVVILFFKIKCGKRRRCKDENCCMRRYCRRAVPNKSELQELERMLQEYRKNITQ